MLARLCRIYPAYTIDALRSLTLREINALIDAATESDA